MNTADHVSEITGPYGDFFVPEKVIQRLWASDYFRGKALRTVSGKTLSLHNPGAINTAEGPDFRDGAWELDGEPVHGDAEIHFYQRDWYAHGHDRDPNFDRVALHLVVFPPPPDAPPIATRTGRHPETVVLLPYLPEDLETLAAEDALMRADGRETDLITHRLQSLPIETRRQRLADASARRYETKLERMRRRLDLDGPEATAHALLLEGLGARRNRPPMAELATRHDPQAFLHLTPDALYREMEGRWKLAGVRPANHPKRRLADYARLLRERPEWQREVLAFFQNLPTGPAHDDTRAFRRAIGLPRIQKHLTHEILRDVAGGTRVNTLAVDVLIPWAQALLGRDLADYWRHWPLGDAPENTGPLLRRLGVTDGQNPLANGHFQGLLGFALEVE